MHLVYGLRPGGMEHGVVKLVNGLDPGRIRSSICSTVPGNPLKAQVSRDVPVFELRRRNGNDPKLVWDLFSLFRRERPHIVHTHAWGTLVEGLVAARMARVPFIIHGEHGTLQLRRYQRWVQRRAWGAANQVLSVSSRLAERISQETGFPLARIRTIRNGVDLGRFGGVDRTAARLALNLPADDILAVTVGRLVPVKDHLSLIEAIDCLQTQGVRLAVAIAGDGPLRDALVGRAAALGVGDRVHLLGHRTDVEKVYAAGDVFVLSSESEGLSNTILEAMASGLPVVATRVGGADEMVQDGVTGRLVPPASPYELAAALKSVIGDGPGRLAMGTAGRARVEAEFSLRSMVRRYETMYVELAGAGRSASTVDASFARDVSRPGTV